MRVDVNENSKSEVNLNQNEKITNQNIVKMKEIAITLLLVCAKVIGQNHSKCLWEYKNKLRLLSY